MIYLASDHGGYKVKSEVEKYLDSAKIAYEDLGAIELDEYDDYPDYVKLVMAKMYDHPGSRAILICRNGVGVSIMANKYHGMRCALSWNPEHIKTAREDDDVNVLALPADFVKYEVAKNVVHGFLHTDFSEKAKHVRRLHKIALLEE